MHHRKSRREFLKLSALATVGLTLAACAPSEPDSDAQGSRAAEQEVIVWFKDIRAVHEMTQERLATEFRELNPGIDAQVKFVPTRQGLANLQSSHAAGEAPDVFLPARGFIQAIIQLGVMHPIPEGLLDVRAEMGNRVADFYKLPDGHYYVLPTGNMPSLLYYNADLLEERGFSADEIPATWSEFVPWASSLTAWDDETLVEAGFAFNGDGVWLTDNIRYQNGGWWFIDDKTCAWSEPESVDAYQFVLDLINKENLQDPVGLPALDQFTQGQAVTAFARAHRNSLLNSQFPDLKWGTLPLPTASGSEPYGRASEETGFVVTTQKDGNAAQEAVWTVWHYLVGPDYQRPYTKLRGLQPALLSLWDESEFSPEDPQWHGIAAATKPGAFRGPGIWPGEVTAQLMRSWTRVRDEGESIEVATEEACAEVEKILNRQEAWPLIIGQKRWESSDWEMAG